MSSNDDNGNGDGKSEGGAAGLFLALEIETHHSSECPIGNAQRAVEKQEAGASYDKNGPAMVNTSAYRSNYDSIFGPKPVGQA